MTAPARAASFEAPRAGCGALGILTCARAPQERRQARDLPIWQPTKFAISTPFEVCDKIHLQRVACILSGSKLPIWDGTG